jgi:hypothetical protein
MTRRVFAKRGAPLLSPNKRERTYVRAGAVLIVVWFRHFAVEGVWAPFTPGDLMNLNAYLGRPFGSLLLDSLRYFSTDIPPLRRALLCGPVSSYRIQPLPYRLWCFALLGIDIASLFRFTRRLSGSREVAFFTVLRANFQAWFQDLYYNTGRD